MVPTIEQQNERWDRVKRARVRPLLTMTLLLLCLVSPAWADFQTGYQAYRHGDYAIALKEFRPLAKRGHLSAQFFLALMYAEGQGVAQDEKEAARWYRLAAQQGLAAAQFSLGVLYKHGRGVPQDYQEALRWITLAAEQGDADAQVSLGTMYHAGDGVPQDDQKAARWYLKAAEQGDAVGQAKLGLLYEQGLGVPRDSVQAYKWLNLAALQGSDEASQLRDHLGKTMTPLQITEAHKLAREWKPRK